MVPDAEHGGNNPAERRKKYISSKIRQYLKLSLIVPIVLHLAMIIIGAMNLKKCPVEKNIPVYLLSAGILGILTKAVAMGRNWIVKYISFDTIMSVIYTIEFVYFLLGSYWVFKEYKPSFNPMDGNEYCNKTAFMFAFIYITLAYVVLAFCLLLLLCCIGGVIALDKIIPVQKEGENLSSENV